MSKRRAPGSGLRGVELYKAISALEDLAKLSLEEEKDEATREGVEASQAKIVSEGIMDLLAKLKEQAEGPLSYSFSNMDFDTLRGRFNIFPRSHLISRGDHAERVVESIAQGGDAYMSSADMYRHLGLLENLIPKTLGLNNEAGARLWIDAIFFRVSAMLSGDERMVLNLEQHVPSVSVQAPDQSRPIRITGTVDYAALATDRGKHEFLLRNSMLQYIKYENPKGLFVTEAKQQETPLAQHIPQAVVEMYASAKYLEKSIIRGALTNGHEWIFLIFYLNEGGNGGIYRESPTIQIQVSENYPYHVLSPGPDIVAGILAHWMKRSFVDLDDSDWFYLSK